MAWFELDLGACRSKAALGPMLDDLVNKTCVRFVLCLCHGGVLWDIWKCQDSWHLRAAAMMGSLGPRLEVDVRVAARLADLRLRFAHIYLDFLRPSTFAVMVWMLIRTEFLFTESWATCLYVQFPRLVSVMFFYAAYGQYPTTARGLDRLSALIVVGLLSRVALVRDYFLPTHLIPWYGWYSR